MKMQESALTLESLIARGEVTDSEGQSLPLHSNTSLAQCRFLQGLVRQVDATTCLEIGLAYGVSSLAICEVISGKDGARLISIDPLQQPAWHGVGLLNLDRAGFGNLVEFHEVPSFQVLPSLLERNRRIQFAYVDSVKVFDTLLVDAFYLIKLLDIGGILVFDDCDWPGVRKLARYLTAMPHLEIAATFNGAPVSRSRRIASALVSRIPGARKLFDYELVLPNNSLGIAASCVAFRKISEDVREWDWFSPR